jgi:hypothetical protein
LPWLRFVDRRTKTDKIPSVAYGPHLQAHGCRVAPSSSGSLAMSKFSAERRPGWDRAGAVPNRDRLRSGNDQSTPTTPTSATSSRSSSGRKTISASSAWHTPATESTRRAPCSIRPSSTAPALRAPLVTLGAPARWRRHIRKADAVIRATSRCDRHRHQTGRRQTSVSRTSAPSHALARRLFATRPVGLTKAYDARI